MASMIRGSISTLDGLPETEKNSGESENTYILRPIFQQRPVADGLLRGHLRNCWVTQAELAWKPGLGEGARWRGAARGGAGPGREGRVGERGAVLGLFSCRGQQRTRLARAVLELLKLAQ